MYNASLAMLVLALVIVALWLLWGKTKAENTVDMLSELSQGLVDENNYLSDINSTLVDGLNEMQEQETMLALQTRASYLAMQDEIARLHRQEADTAALRNAYTTLLAGYNELKSAHAFLWERATALFIAQGEEANVRSHTMSEPQS